MYMWGTPDLRLTRIHSKAALYDDALLHPKHKANLIFFCGQFYTFAI